MPGAPPNASISGCAKRGSAPKVCARIDWLDGVNAKEVRSCPRSARVLATAESQDAGNINFLLIESKFSLACFNRDN